VPKPNGEARVKFKAMVVGATGAIGSVCARLLVKAAEEVYWCRRRPQAAGGEGVDLKETPDAKMFLARAPTRHRDMDMIVTATRRRKKCSTS